MGRTLLRKVRPVTPTARLLSGRTHLRSPPTTSRRQADDAPSTSMASGGRRRHLADTPSTPTARPRSERIHPRSAPMTRRRPVDDAPPIPIPVRNPVFSNVMRTPQQVGSGRWPPRTFQSAVCQKSKSKWVVDSFLKLDRTRHSSVHVDTPPHRLRERVQAGSIFGARRRRADDAPTTPSLSPR